ncbi:hypothetical protein P4O66_002584 [Electrophorus voltai]|uniref:G-protein coupled receptors family 1 profile domain-containing protein n=1 Tax=Electrophorus voltai TaxID=2609070 RepID=A0AAD9DR41_9TELE|nr:hypothetical protein P4O66_002584 [Electrophorus voltai]
MVRFIPLKTLPTTLETADLLFRQVFRQFGLPEDIVSDWGPQFTSRVWRELLGKLNIMIWPPVCLQRCFTSEFILQLLPLHHQEGHCSSITSDRKLEILNAQCRECDKTKGETNELGTCVEDEGPEGLHMSFTISGFPCATGSGLWQETRCAACTLGPPTVRCALIGNLGYASVLPLSAAWLPLSGKLHDDGQVELCTCANAFLFSADADCRPAAEPGGTMVGNVTPASGSRNSGSEKGPGEDAEHYNYLALACGIPLILIIILGNVLVCLSVLTERSLKTATNYFIVSLAVADLLLAVLVLPLYVYSEFLGGKWTLSMYICDALMTMDVMLCTASILNLCAISIDSSLSASLLGHGPETHAEWRGWGTERPDTGQCEQDRREGDRDQDQNRHRDGHTDGHRHRHKGGQSNQ